MTDPRTMALQHMLGAMGQPQGKRSKADPGVVYMGPEHGPFMCQHCIHHQAPGCELVSGRVDPKGCCDLFQDAPGAGPSV